MRKVLAAVSIVLVFACALWAQASFWVGDRVEALRGSSWVEGTIESATATTIKVRFGPGKYDFQNYANPSTAIRAVGTAAKEKNNQAMWNAFRADTLDKYFRSVEKLANAYDKRYLSAGGQGTPAEWQTILSELAELDNVCRSKYADITDDPSYMRDGLIDYHYTDWCKIAARRVELEKAARTEFARGQVTLTTTKDNLNFAFNHQKNRVPDETQEMIFDRSKWETAMSAKLKPRFAQYNVEMPADFYTEVYKRGDELKTLLDRTAPTRAWEQPPFKDAAVETFIKGKYAKEYPGVKIMNSGVDYNTWAERKGLSYLGSDSTFRYYKVEYNYYKRGWVLMKQPNRPHCQASEWIVGRGKSGLVAVTVGGSSIFVKCP